MKIFEDGTISKSVEYDKQRVLNIIDLLKNEMGFNSFVYLTINDTEVIKLGKGVRVIKNTSELNNELLSELNWLKEL
jgi:hypothetical protein